MSSDGVIVSGRWVVPVVPSGTVVEDGGVLVRDGVVVEVGRRAELVERHPAATRVHHPWGLVIPAFVNAHTHLAMTMFRGVAADRDLMAFLDVVMPLEARLLDRRRVAVATRAAIVESLLAGVTTALDMYFLQEAAIPEAEALGFRLATGPTLLDPVPTPLVDGYDPAARLRWARRTLETDPPPIPVVAAHAAYTTSPEMLAEGAAIAAEAGAVFHIHAAENAAEVAMVRERFGEHPVEHLDRLGILRERTVLAHAVHLEEHHPALLAERGAGVAHCPASNLLLGCGVAPVAALLAAGATVGIGTDGPASSDDLDVLGAARLASMLHKGSTGDPTVLGAHTVLALATDGGARLLGCEGRFGRLTPGAEADLVVVDLDRPHTQPVFDPVVTLVRAARSSDVVEVWSRGRRVVEGGRPVDVDPAEITTDLAGLGAEVAQMLMP